MSLGLRWATSLLYDGIAWLRDSSCVIPSTPQSSGNRASLPAFQGNQ